MTYRSIAARFFLAFLLVMFIPGSILAASVLQPLPLLPP
jgi:hypothetical protein